MNQQICIKAYKTEMYLLKEGKKATKKKEEKNKISTIPPRCWHLKGNTTLFVLPYRGTSLKTDEQKFE